MERLEGNQEFIKGALAGIIAAIGLFVFVESFRWAGFIKFGQSYLAGDTVFTFENNLVMNLIAFITTIGIGAFWGIIISFLFSKVLAGDHYLFKVLFISFCIFFFHLGFLDEPFHYKREIHERTLDLLVIMTGYLLYGIILAIGLKKLKIITDLKK